jgi:hypothetical protein
MRQVTRQVTRLVRLAAAVAAALTLAAAPAVAGGYYDVPVVYGIPPFAPALPAVGYVFDPSDHGAPVYIVDQGPVFAGPGIYAYHEIDVPLAYPTHWGGYAVVRPYAHARRFPYVRHVPDVRVLAPPVGIAPYAAYVYWPRSNARIMHVR